MKFYFDNLVLFLKNGKKRTLTFLPNKINVITGDSNTGKTAILAVIDYCLFSSTHDISESIINENVEWYGIKISINDKRYFIARKSPSESNVSHDYYFSSVGDVPEGVPTANITEPALKRTLETEFGIDSDTRVTYGGRALSSGSKVSLRYFLLLNTISQDIITHSQEFFDKQKNEKYREALPRIFDLAVGIDTVENILKREKREEIEREIRKLEKESERISRKHDAFYSQLKGTIQTAKEYGLLPEEDDVGEAVEQLNTMVRSAETITKSGAINRYNEINTDISKLTRKIRNLNSFTSEYKRYKANLKETSDSLKSLDFISEHYSDVLKTSIFKEIVAGLEADHKKIKKAVASKTPLDSNISTTIKEYEAKLRELVDERDTMPQEVKAFENDKEKYIFVGEVKAKLDLYQPQPVDTHQGNEERIKTLTSRLDELVVTNVSERKELFVKTLEEIIQEYIIFTRSALANYKDYRASFNYKDKVLQLRKPRSNHIENVGSSSNHMFLHLFLFLGLHEKIIREKIPYVASFLIIDQFSRPYFEDRSGKIKESIDSSDIAKVTAALNLLDNFVTNMKKLGGNFQMIVFEHISPDTWSGFSNFHLVESFKDGNALIPDDYE
ncbi:DUF3732 domain-containing protein [Porticoccaceae bacterium]|nr:DUF3732 domain-containing protein [Porticoccaceae bacterium]